MVSDIRCPALHDSKLKWGEARQQPRRGWSPVEHRGTFVCPSTQVWGLRGLIWSLRGLYFGLEGYISALKGHISSLRGQISGLSGPILSKRADFRHKRANVRPPKGDFRSRIDFRPKRLISGLWGVIGGTKGRNDGRTDERTNESPPVFYRTLSPSRPLPKWQTLQNHR